jgi:hypothetical protein
MTDILSPIIDATGKGEAMKFRAKILATGKTAAGIKVPEEIVTGLGKSRHPAVRATINGYTYRSSIAVMGGVFMLGVSNEVRAAAKVAAGETVDIEVELDTQPREVTVPADLAAALKKDAKAKKFFEDLAYSHQRWYVLWIESAKKAETREARVAKAVVMLREGKLQG